jgi:hypothetical protein
MLRNIVGDIAEDPASLIDIPLAILTGSLVRLPSKRAALELSPVWLLVLIIPTRGRITAQVM